jgi:hypothetical protein
MQKPPSYLQWVAENLDGNAGMAAAIVLKGRSE